MSRFADAVASAAVPEGAVRLWRLPQAGFVLRGGGRTVAVDPWLSDELERAGVERASAVPCGPDELPELDLVCCTHAHPDHLDPPTLAAVARRSPDARFVVPVPLMDAVAGAGIDRSRVVGVLVDQPVTVAGVEVLALPARHDATPEAPDDYGFDRDEAGRHRAVGYVLRLGALAVFHSGDTLRIRGDADRLRAEGIDLAVLPVNGRDWMRETQGLVGNMHPAEAAALAAEAGIAHLVPCHYDGVAGNTGGAAATVEHVVANRLPVTVHVVSGGSVVVMR